MNNNDVFGLLIDVVFSIIPELGVLGPKSQDPPISFCLGEVETLPQSYLRALQIISEKVLMRYETGKINNLAGKYIMELSKLKHLQR